MDDSADKNGGPNHLAAWRRHRNMTQADLAVAVGTNQNMIGYLESGERALSAKWLRKLALVLNTTPGLILDQDPEIVEHDVIDLWAHASSTQKRQIATIVRTIVKDGAVG